MLTPTAYINPLMRSLSCWIIASSSVFSVFLHSDLGLPDEHPGFLYPLILISWLDTWLIF